MSDEVDIPEEGVTPHRGRRPMLRRLWIGCLGIVVALIALLALFPAILSSRVARRAVVRSVARRTGADVDIAAWRFGWRRGFEIAGIRYRDRRRGLGVHVANVSSDAGLWGLLTAPGRPDVQEVRIIRPVVDYVTPVTPVAGGAVISDGVAKAQASTVTAAAMPVRLHARFVLIDGRVRVASAPGRPALTTDHVAGTVVLKTLLKPVEIDVSGRLVESRGGWRVAGTWTPPRGPLWTVADGRANLACKWNGVELGYVDDWLPTNGIPSLAGVSTGALDLVSSGDRNLAAKGQVSVVGLRGSGGVLGNDKVRLDAVTVDLDLAFQGDELRIEQLLVQSDLVRGRFRGMIDRAAVRRRERHPVAALCGNASLSLWVDAAGFATQLPETLRLREGLEISDGELSFSGRVTSVPDSVDYDIRFEARDLVAVGAGRRVAWREPFRIEARGGYGVSGFSLEQFSARSFFVEAEGQGTLDDLSVRFLVDLDKACSELGGVFQLPGRATGRLAAGISSRSQAEGSRAVRATLRLEQCDLQREGEPAHTVGSLAVAADGDLRFGRNGQIMGGGHSVFSLTSDMAQVSCSVGSFALDADGVLVRVSDASLRSEGDLGDIARLLRGIGVVTNLPPAGAFSVTAWGAFQDGRFSIRESSVKLAALRPSSDAPAGVQEDVGLRFAGEFGKNDIRIAALRLESRPLVVSCWGSINALGGRADARVRGTLACDYVHVGRIVRAYKPDFAWELEGKEAGSFSLELPLGVREGRERWRDTQAELPLRLSRAAAYGMVCGPLSTPVHVRSGIVSLHIDTVLNGGRFVCAPRVDMTGEPAVLTLEDSGRVLRNVTLTQDMVAVLLSRAHPYFHDCILIGDAARADVSVDDLFVPLETGLGHMAAFSGEMTLTNVVVGVTGLVGQVLSLAQVQTTNAAIPFQSVAFRCRDGWITSTPLTVNADVTDVTFRGRVGLDGVLDYTADVPLTREMFKFEDRLWKYFKDSRVELEISGTLDRPKISSETWRANFDKLLKQATDKLVREESVRLLEKLFK